MKLQYLGFLGFIGLLGFFTNNPGFYGFFGFFGFFGFKKVIQDERFQENVGKAAKNAFIISLVIFTLATVIASFTGSPVKVFWLAFAVNFAAQIATFVISFNYYERS